jgi:hypothetical protein
MKVKLSKKQKWMAETERLINAARPQTTGKLDWDTITHMFNSGHSEYEACVKYVTYYTK